MSYLLSSPSRQRSEYLGTQLRQALCCLPHVAFQECNELHPLGQPSPATVETRERTIPPRRGAAVGWFETQSENAKQMDCIRHQCKSIHFQMSASVRPKSEREITHKPSQYATTTPKMFKKNSMDTNWPRDVCGAVSVDYFPLGQIPCRRGQYRSSPKPELWR